MTRYEVRRKDEGKKKKPKQPRAVYGQSLLRRLAIKAALWGGVLLFLFLAYCALTLPDLQEADAFKRKPSVTVLDAAGSVIAEYGERAASPVTLKELPPHVPKAFLAIEDRRFYAHFGFDPIGIARGVIVNPLLGKRATGGSTITQQLAKNLFLSPDRQVKRKVQELMLALWLEATYSKDQILEAYLNRVYFGAGAYGIEAAARTYFGKSARRLNIRESALLAGLLKAPSRFSPRNDADEAEARTRVVLAAMKDAGFLTAAEQRALDKLPVLERQRLTIAGEGRYFADWVLAQTQELVGDAAEDVIVKTTLNRAAQRAAESAIKSALEKDGADLHIGQAAAVLLGNDGAVRAMVGGRDYQESQFNRVTQAMRQPGSAFKPFIYLAGLDAGLTPESVFEDAPRRYGRWSPQNYDGRYRGTVSMRQAFYESLNTVAVQVLDSAGVERARRLAMRAGISSAVPHELSIALGSAVLTPLELTGAYAVIANDGQGVAPYAITEITNTRGKVLYRHRAVRLPQLLDSQATRQLTSMMVDVVEQGTGRGAGFGRPIAGKTGTSSDYRDAWFVGFSGNYTLGVWVGNDNNKPMRKVTGGGTPARIWRTIMQAAEAEVPVAALHLPASVGVFDVIAEIIGGNDPANPEQANIAPVPVPEKEAEASATEPLDLGAEFGALLNRLSGEPEAATPARE